MSLYETTTARCWSLFPVVGISYLIGLLMNDLQFDVTDPDIVTRTYYCELMKSFSEPFGAARILLPAAACGACQLIVLFAPLRDSLLSLQRWVILHFVCIGIPLIGVSLSLCAEACSRSHEIWNIRAEIFTIHVLMLILFLAGLWCQSRILLSTLD